MEFEKKIAKTVEKYSMLSPGDTVVIGLSGGADSVALFKVLCALKDKYTLTLHAAHINHMIRGDEAKRDADYARKLAEESGVAFHLLECDVPQKAAELGISEEMAGRQIRYDFFNEILSDRGKIAVAHHKGDSAETTLINMIRGSSLNGLKGISPIKGNIIRPLIECDRSEIEEYLINLNIPFMTDSTNSQDIYTRNMVRNRIIPAMGQINPNIVSTIYENSRLLGDDEDFINHVCSEYERICITAADDSVVLDFSKIPNMHMVARRRLVIRSCEIMSGTRQGISAANVESVLTLPTGGRTSFRGIYAQRSYEKFIFTHSIENPLPFSYKVTPPAKAVINETGKAYNLEIVSANDISFYEKGVIYLDADTLGELTLRSRRDGDVFSPLGLGGNKKIKDFLIDLKIPRSQRATIPVLESDNKITALLCLRADEAYKVTQTTTKILKISEVAK